MELCSTEFKSGKSMKINLNNGWQLAGEYDSPEAAVDGASKLRELLNGTKIDYEFVAVNRNGSFEVYWRNLKAVEAEVL